MTGLSHRAVASALLALGLGGCGEPSATVVPEGTREAPPSRVEAVGAREEFHLQHVSKGIEELPDRNGFRAGFRSEVGHGGLEFKAFA